VNRRYLRNPSMGSNVAVIAAPKPFPIVLAFAAVYTIWGSTYLAILLAIRSIPPFFMASARFLTAGIIMYAIARVQGAPNPQRSTWKSAFIVGACLLLFGNGGVTIAEKWVPTGLAALLVAVVPIYMALLGWLSYTAPRPTALMWMGLVGGFTGVGVLVGPALHMPAGGGHFGLGASILLVGSLLWSIGSLYSRRVSTTQSLFMAASQQMICGGMLLGLAGFLLGEQRELVLHRISWLSLGAFAYLVLIGAVIGYTAYFYLLRHCDPAKVATYAYVNPIVALILGALFAGERLTGRTAIAAVLIIGSVATVVSVQQIRFKSTVSINPMVEPVTAQDE
jgi:drug/metabolite transporter (DMT)-like permease